MINKTKILLFIFFFISASAIASTEVKFSLDACKKVTGFSKKTQELASTKLRVSASSIKFYGIDSDSSDSMCIIKIDTPKGIKYLKYTPIFPNAVILRDGNNYWVHFYRI